MVWTLTRRNLVASVALAIGGAVLTPAALIAQPSELMAPGPLGEKTLGDKDAPTTVIEYASMTCVHCANFHTGTFPAIKERYIDTGKVFFIFREFPFDPLSKGAFMLARCAPEDRYFAMIDVLFEQQESWTRTDKPLPVLLEIAKQAGFTQESFEACLTNREVQAGVEEVAQRAAEKFNVRSTPSFFVNGELHTGYMSIDEFSKLLDK